MNKRYIDNLIVVEGKNDANKIKSIFPEVDIIITNGSEINKQTIESIVKASNNDTVVLCLDPDGPGEKIRRKILEYTDNVCQVFAKKCKAISNNKKKIGIEHMSKENILDTFRSNYRRSCNRGWLLSEEGGLRRTGRV